MAPRTLLEAVTYFSDLDTATQYFARLRRPDGPTCSRCGCQEYSYLKTRRLWKCKGCKYQYSVKKGTVFEDSALGIHYLGSPGQEFPSSVKLSGPRSSIGSDGKRKGPAT